MQRKKESLQSLINNVNFLIKRNKINLKNNYMKK